MMTFHETLKPGDKVKCCGGMDATVICVSAERILLHTRTRFGEKYITGHNPHTTGDGVVWDWGHYYESWGQTTPEKNAETLMAALKDYLNIREEDE